MARQVSPSELNEGEWALLAPLLPPAKPRGRPRTVARRRLVTGVCSSLRSGCAWRQLPREQGPWQSVQWDCRRGPLEGTWTQIPARLRELARLPAGRDPTPSAASMDRQSVTTRRGGMRGDEGQKQVAGRKRHLLVDSAGVLRCVVVHSAQLPDRAGGRLVLEARGARFPHWQRIGADQGSTGALQRWAAARHGLTLAVVAPHWRQLKRQAPDLLSALGHAPGFHVLPRRWVVERPCSWLGRHRRMRKDDERLAGTADAFLSLVGLRLLLVRLSRGEK